MEDRYEPSSRFWHSAASVEGFLYIWGGNTLDFKLQNCRRELAGKIEKFDPVNDVWRQLKTTGTPHPGLSAVACASFGEYVYAYGGFDGEQLQGVLSQLDLKTLNWSQLSYVELADDGPMKKDACGMAHFSDDKLVLIGGYGYPTGPVQPRSLFVRNELFNDGTGWTNEIHIYNIHEGVWSSPNIKGTRPPPCADFTLTNINNDRAVLYGGCRPPEGKSLDKDLYVIDLNNMEITRIERKEGMVWPEVTLGHHAACCLGFNSEHPQLLVSGGRTCYDKGLKDVWAFNLSQKKWKHIGLPENTQLPRWGHSATTIILPDGKEEVILFGGSSSNYQYNWNNFRSNCLRLVESTAIMFDSVVHSVKCKGQLNFFRHNPNLAQFVVEGTFTGRQLGSGYFGTVEEIKVKGTLCAGKKVKPAVIVSERDRSGGWDVVKLYTQEYQVMSRLRHPNIVQFLGICLHPTDQLPVLVMEILEGNLYDLLEAVPNIPLVLKRSMLSDVAKGLLYLHPHLIHRDLTAKNVLLTSFFTAKISDLGNCCILDMHTRFQKLTPYPGTREYMPPEVFSNNAHYGPSLDIFSFGHIALLTLTQITSNTFLKPNNDYKDYSEVERRSEYFKSLELDRIKELDYEKFIQLIQDCLHNSPSCRPTAEQLVITLEETKERLNENFELLDAIKQVTEIKKNAKC